MFILQLVVSGFQFFISAFQFVLWVSAYTGRSIILTVAEIYVFIKDVSLSGLAILEEFFYLLYELFISINVAFAYGQSCVHSAFTDLMHATTTMVKIIYEVAARFCGALMLLVNGVRHFFTLLEGALLLISDGLYWLLTIIPKTLLAISLNAGDYIVSLVDFVKDFVVQTILSLINDFFRLTTGAICVIVLIRNRRRLLRAFNTVCHTIILCIPNKFRRLIVWCLRFGPRISFAKNEKLPESTACIICCDRRKSVVLLPCRHLCLCQECIKMLCVANCFCPLCRTVVLEWITVYN